MSSLADDVSAFIGRYVVMDDDKRLIVALWVLHTYVFNRFEQTPYLAVNSPEKQCGKTRTLEVLAQISARPWSAVNPSEAVVYHKIEADTPTLLLDEVDGIFSAKSDKYEHLRTLLNAGTRDGVKVPRKLNPRGKGIDEFSVFCPKVLAGIGTLPETLVDRSIPIRLERKTRDQMVERFRPRYVVPVATALRDQIEAWLTDVVLDDEPELPEELTDRQQDCAEPLLSIADALGCGDEARRTLVSLYAGERADSEVSDGLTLLRDVWAWFAVRPAVESAYTTWLLDWLNKEMDESPWKTYDFGKPLDDRGLAALLKKYGIKSENVRADGEKQLKGYKRHKLEYVWGKYGGAVTAEPGPAGDAVTATSVTGTADGTAKSPG